MINITRIMRRTYAEYIAATLEQRKECIEHITNLVQNKKEPLHLIHNKEVIQWLFGEHSILEAKLPEAASTSKSKTRTTELLKAAEDTWGRETLHTIRPDLRLDK
jgi:hypothetical protein